MKPLQIAATALASAALAGGVTAFAFDAATPSAAARAQFTVTPAQLKINQRISQAAVRRANELRADVDEIQRTLGQVPPPVPGATCGVETFTGSGDAGIGGIARSCESVWEWTHNDNDPDLAWSFGVRDEGFDLSFSSEAPSGSSIEPPGLHPNVRVSAHGDWTITVRPR